MMLMMPMMMMSVIFGRVNVALDISGEPITAEVCVVKMASQSLLLGFTLESHYSSKAIVRIECGLDSKQLHALPPQCGLLHCLPHQCRT